MKILIALGSFLVVSGVAGSLIPSFPGPVLSYFGLLSLHFIFPGAVPLSVYLIFGLALISLFILDYLMPALSAKFLGASTHGILGAFAGSISGMIFFPPVGIFVGALFGASIGELLANKSPVAALKTGVGTVICSFAVILLQIIFSVSAAVYFFWVIMSS